MGNFLSNSAQAFTGTDNNTPLLIAARDGNLQEVFRLLTAATPEQAHNNAAFIDQTNNNGKTALIWAARNGHFDVVDLLLKHNANVNVQTHHQWTALQFAADNNHPEVVERLVKAGADITLKNRHGLSAEGLAQAKGYTNVLNALAGKPIQQAAVSSPGNPVSKR